MAKRSSRLSPMAMPSDDRESVTIRKITNGFLIERSGTRKGEYYSEQEYSPSKPQLLAAPAKKGKR